MKKLLLMIFGAFMLSTSLKAMELVPLSVKIEPDDMPLGHGYAKSPMRPPLVYIEDHTLTFSADHPDYLLIIKDEDGEEVYTTTVFSAETLVTLPSSLSGNYEIQLQMGNWLFTGWISL